VSPPASSFRASVSGLGFRVQDFGFSGSGIRVSGTEFRVQNFGCGVQKEGRRLERVPCPHLHPVFGLESRGWGSGFKISGSRVHDFGSRVQDFGFRIHNFGCVGSKGRALASTRAVPILASSAGPPHLQVQGYLTGPGGDRMCSSVGYRQVLLLRKIVKRFLV